MNHNMLTERALRDVFSTTSYISMGTKDAPLTYGEKDEREFRGDTYRTTDMHAGFEGRVLRERGLFNVQTTFLKS